FRKLASDNRIAQLEKAWKILDESEIPRTPLLFLIMIDTLGRNNILDKMLHYYYMMPQYKVRPTRSIYIAILDALSRDGDVEGMWKMMQRMPGDADLTPDGPMYERLLLTYARLQKWEQMDSL